MLIYHLSTLTIPIQHEQPRIKSLLLMVKAQFSWDMNVFFHDSNVGDCRFFRRASGRPEPAWLMSDS